MFQAVCHTGLGHERTDGNIDAGGLVNGQNVGRVPRRDVINFAASVHLVDDFGTQFVAHLYVASGTSDHGSGEDKPAVSVDGNGSGVWCDGGIEGVVVGSGGAGGSC